MGLLMFGLTACAGESNSRPAQSGESQALVVAAGSDESDATPTPAAEPDDEARAEKKSISPELLYQLLAGEIAAQRSSFDVAVGEYVAAAKQSEDPRVAKRAAQMGVFAKDFQAALVASQRWAELDPTSIDPQKHLGVLHLRLGNYEASASAFEKFLSLLAERGQGTSSRLYEVAAAILVRETDTEGALAVMRLLAKRVPDDAGAQEAYARMAFSSGNAEESLAAAKRLLAADKANRHANVIVANALLAEGKPQEAVAQLKAALELAPDDHQLRLAYARILLQAKDPKLARAEFERLAQDVPDNADVLYALALLALQAGENDKAEPLLKQLVEMGKRASDAAYYLARIASQAGDFDAALKWFKAVKSGDFADESRVQVAAVLADQGKLDEARAHLKELRQSDSKLLERSYLIEAGMLAEAEMTTQAIALLDEAIGIRPTNIDMLYTRGLLAETLGDLQTLERDLRRILELDPDHVDSLNALGYTFADHNLRLQEAFELIERALKLRPNEPAILDSMGWVHYRLGNLDDAERYLRKALESDYDGEIAAHLGEVLWKKEQHDDAKAVLDEALSRDPDDQALQQTFERLFK